MMESKVSEQIKRIGANLDGESAAYQRILDSQKQLAQQKRDLKDGLHPDLKE